MGKAHFYALWSLHEAPRQFISNVNRKSYQLQIPLPLPKQLVIFSVGDWTSFSYETTISVEVFVSPDVQPQKIGVLSSQSRCLVWEGEWTISMLTESTEKRRRGANAKLLLTICGEMSTCLVSSTPLLKRKSSAHNQYTNLSQTLFSSASNYRSSPDDTVSYAELKTSKAEIQNFSFGVWTLDKTPRRTVIGQGGCIWSYEGPETKERTVRVPSPRKRKLNTSCMSQNVESVKRARSCRAEYPSKRWHHSMCLCDPDTAVLIGGETADQAQCTDTIWKLEIEGDFWFPLNSSGASALPPSAEGHSAVFDPEHNVVYVYGGLKSHCFTDIYVLDTINWKWKVIHTRGNVPLLAYHSASIYKGELYVFGGLQTSHGLARQVCSNALYIFNPEHELWYQPIVEGDRPLPRFGHSTTLLPDKMVIFGGQKTATYLNDLHILDLGFMEYTAVKYDNIAPVARGFHAALPVSNNKLLISGGCSALGALQDLHLFNLDTNCWTSLLCPLLCSKPRAGHSLISYADKRDQGDRHIPCPSTQCTVLVFGGSDCAGIFYNDLVKCIVEIPSDEQSHNSRERLQGKTVPVKYR